MFEPSSFQQLTLVARHLLHSTEGTPEIKQEIHFLLGSEWSSPSSLLFRAAPHLVPMRLTPATIA
jgi:hypothetical protein